MWPCSRHAFLAAALCALAGPVRADDVHLAGGNVIEGKVVREQNRVTIELESGRITLSADSVERIDRRESAVEHFERSRAALKPDDVKGRMALADYCRDHDMRSRERQILQEVIERAPDHADARARLGYVKSEGAWITREAQYRAQGMVQVDGVWMTREKAQELARQDAAAARERQRAELALEAERLAVRKRELELEQQRAEKERAASAPGYITPIYGGGYFYSGGFCAPGERCGGGRAWSSAPRTQAFPINGVRDPRDTSFPLNGVRDPREFLRTR